MKNKIVWISLLILIAGLGVYLGLNLGGSKDQSINSLTKKDNLVIDSLKSVIKARNDSLNSLSENLNNLRKTKTTRIIKVKELSAKNSLKYLENKVDSIDSLRFFSSTDSSVVIGINGIRTINGLLEDREIMKNELIYCDSIIDIQGKNLKAKDSLIGTIESREKKEIQFYKKKNLFWKIGTGLGAVGIILLAL